MLCCSQSWAWHKHRWVYCCPHTCTQLAGCPWRDVWCVSATCCVAKPPASVGTRSSTNALPQIVVPNAHARVCPYNVLSEMCSVILGAVTCTTRGLVSQTQVRLRVSCKAHSKHAQDCWNTNAHLLMLPCPAARVVSDDRLVSQTWQRPRVPCRTCSKSLTARALSTHPVKRARCWTAGRSGESWSCRTWCLRTLLAPQSRSSTTSASTYPQVG